MESRQHLPRKQILVDRRLQLAVAFPIAMTLLGLAVAFAIYTFVLTGEEDGPTSEAVSRTGTLVVGGYFLLSVLAALLVSVQATHRVAGPATVIERALRRMREGDLEGRLALRHGDHMQSLAAELSAFREQLLATREAEQELFAGLRAALDRHDIELARRLLANHPTLLAGSQSTQPAPPAPGEVSLAA